MKLLLGPELPVSMKDFSLVSTTQGLLAVGGHDDTYKRNKDEILKLKCQDDEDLSTVFNPNDLSGYGGDQEHAVPEEHGEDDDYYYDGEYYEDNYDIDQQPEMIDLRGTQPLVIDNYSGKRRKR